MAFTLNEGVGQQRPRRPPATHAAPVRANTRAASNQKLARAVDAIEADLAADWTIDALAEAAAMSPFHFARRFSARYGEPPRRFLQRRRLETARAFLASGAYSVTGACFAVGYSSLSSFCLAFRRHFGMRPSSCRRAS